MNIIEAIRQSHMSATLSTAINILQKKNIRTTNRSTIFTIERASTKLIKADATAVFDQIMDYNIVN